MNKLGRDTEGRPVRHGDAGRGLGSRLRDALLLIGVVAAVGFVYGLVSSYPDLKRYLKMRSM